MKMLNIQMLRNWLAENDVDLNGDARYLWEWISDLTYIMGYVIEGNRNGTPWELFIGEAWGVAIVIQSDPTGTRLTEQNFAVTDYPGVVHLCESSGDNTDLFDRVFSATGVYPGNEDNGRTRLELA